MRKVSKSLAVILSLVASMYLYSCEEESAFEQRVNKDDNKIKTYLNENNISATKHTSGIYYEALETSSSGDEVKSGDVVSFYYKIETLDGTYEEVMTDSLHPVLVEQNYNRMLPSGVLDGFGMMKESEKYRLFIPSHLAFGGYSNVDFFGANSIFIVDVEIVDILDKDEIFEWEKDSINSFIENNAITDVESFDSGLKYKILEEGDGDSPIQNSEVEINFTRTYLDGSGEVESDESITTQVNDNYLTEGLVEGIKKMKEGETAMFIMPSKLAYGSSIQVLPRAIREDLLEDGILNFNIEPFSPVIYEIELIEVN